MENSVLDLFHPLIRRWFVEKVGVPTDIQVKAWPCIAKGEHALITAPTGSGKTLTAFLWALQKLITGEWPGGQVRVLYVSPLKALNNDVQRNLLKPLQELRGFFKVSGEHFPAISVLTRSGDTPPGERRQMLRRPPEILITTPESLNLILSSKNNRRILSGVETVILDEIHAVLGDKRGTHLITAVDRLILLAGEFQRIALSATVRPLDKVAGFVGGYYTNEARSTLPGTGNIQRCLDEEWEVDGKWEVERKDADSNLNAGNYPDYPGYRYFKRPVTVLKSADKKKYHLTVEAVDTVDSGPEQDAIWQTLATALVKVIQKNTSTLVFCNNRRAVEKMTRFINDAAGEALVYSHHGSLAKELRLTVEEKLKKGELKGIVATNSLELGIDIGELDVVVLVQTPPSLTAAVQRIGRAGHEVGEVSRAIIYPIHGFDLVEAAVTSLNLPRAEIEAVEPVDGPLDVLAQVILSMTAVETWHVDELYAFIKTSYPYRKLSRKSYDLLLDMLAGRYADTRLRELKPRIILDKLDGTVRARDGADRLVFMGGGTIPDRGYFDLRLADTKAKVGELDEEFVWERNLGETFLLGTQVWRIIRVTHNDVEVVPGDQTINIIPFWRAEEQNRDFFYSEKIGFFLEDAEEKLSKTSGGNIDLHFFAGELMDVYGWTAKAAGRLAEYLIRQREVTGKPLPHRHHMLIEHFDDPMNKADSKQVILHTLWGGRVNRPFSLALSAAWEQKFGYPLEIYTGNNNIMIMLPHSFESRDLFKLVSPHNLENLLRRKLESSGYFGARFRENAGRALLLPKAGFKKRMPLWLNRLRSKKLMAAVSSYGDFPIMLETWRTCFRDEFDLETVKRLLDEINDGLINISETVTHQPSPFSGDLIWRQTNKYMYEDDTPFSHKQSGVKGELIKELIYSPHLRPHIPEALIGELDGKLKRTASGYAPHDGDELLLWLKERLFIPVDEANTLFSAMERDYHIDHLELLASLGGKAAWLQMPRMKQPGLCALEVLPRINASLGDPLPFLKPLTPQASGELATGLNKTGTPYKLIQETWPGKEGIIEETSQFVSQWLSYYGPVSPEFIALTLGLLEEVHDDVLVSLLKEESIVTDVITSGTDETEICDIENLERLLAMVRRARRPEFKPLPVTQLPLFLALYQGIAQKGMTLEDLQDRLERLFGYVSLAHLWEEVILPARMEPYYNAWMDSLIQAGDLIWFGCGPRRIAFCFREDLALFAPGSAQSHNTNGASPNDHEYVAEREASIKAALIATQEATEADLESSAPEPESGSGSGPAPEDVGALFPEQWGKYDYDALIRYTGLPGDELSGRLWRHVWEGRITNDSMAALRQGIISKFSVPQAESRPGVSPQGRMGYKGNRSLHPGRTGFRRWNGSKGYMPGSWFILPGNEDHDLIDLIEQEELVKDRIRQLLFRYGVLCRELLQQELPEMQWRRLIRTLRLMEFSGEIYGGHFFEGITGLQFISMEAYRILQHDLPEEVIYWLNAADPASPCGLKIPGLDPDLPARLSTNYIVCQGAQLKLVAKRNGRELIIKAGPDDPALPPYFDFCKTLLTRNFNPLKCITVETINGQPVHESPYREVLKEIGFHSHYKGMELRRQYH